MKPESQIVLDKFQPRHYQVPLLDAYENKGYKRIIAVLPRRAGKDVACWNLAIRQCIRKTIVCYYILPTFAMARRIIWDSVLNNGMRFLDFIPSELVDSMNASDMKIRFTNGSLLQLCGSDNIDALVGTNPNLIIYSEYALQSDMAYKLLRPIVVANDGAMIFVSTPRGKNHFYELFNIAQDNPSWYSYRMTIEETGHIPLNEIAKERAEGLMSEDLIQQEYYVSFSAGIEGAYYTKYLDRMKLESRVTLVPWEVNFRVHTAWDLGVNDPTTIIFFQVCGQIIRIIDCYTNNDKGLDHYAKILSEKEYVYGKHIAPHDIQVREFAGGGVKRIDMARKLGINFVVAPNIPIEDGIECCRATLGRIWIDEQKCQPLIKALESYRREYDNKRKVYKDHPLHDWSSNFADSFRMLCVSLPKTRDDLTSAAELDKRYKEVISGQPDIPDFFKDQYGR
jgi:hypothetical protein